MKILKLMAIFLIATSLRAEAQSLASCQTLGVGGSAITIELAQVSDLDQLPASARLVARGRLTTNFDLVVTSAQVSEELIELSFTTTARGFTQAGDTRVPLTGTLLIDLRDETGEINLSGTELTSFPTLFAQYDLSECRLLK